MRILKPILSRNRKDSRKAAKPMPDEYFVELVQDIPGASDYELEVLGKLHGFSIIQSDQRFAIISGDWNSLKDAAFVRKVSRILFRAKSFESLEIPELPEGKFYVRFTDSSDCHDAKIEPQIGTMLKGQGRISFKNPDFIIRAYHHGEWFLCLEVHSGNSIDFEKRRAPMRPFFSPISIDPRHARFMVNCSETEPGDLIFDPFCGTGGILLEAGLMNRRIMGNDWTLQMETGASLNLKYFGIRDFNITNEDFLKLDIEGPVDAIVTDLPYGKNSRLSQKDIAELYRNSFKKFQDILKDNGVCVAVVSNRAILDEAEPYFQITMVFPYRVHRSLTRYFAILRRK